MKPGWNLPLRVWLAAVLVAVALSPLLAWLGTIVAVQGPLKNRATPWERRSREAMEQAALLIRSRHGEWTSPAFQRELSEWLERGRLAVALVDTGGKVVYRHGPLYQSIGEPGSRHDDQIGGYGAPTHVGWVRGPSGEVIGTYVLTRAGTDPFLFWLVLAAAGSLSLATTLAVWWIGRSISRPVHALARAAHQVKQGELDFDVPTSRVQELNELSAAFGAMRDGLRSSIMQQAAMEQERRMFLSAGLPGRAP